MNTNVSSTNIDGNALAVEGDTCEDGSAVYAYVREFDDVATATTVAEIAAVPAVFTLGVNGTKELKVIGLKGGAYASIEIDNSDCTFVSSASSTAQVVNGVVTGKGTGKAYITVNYNGIKDVVEVTVQ